MEFHPLSFSSSMVLAHLKEETPLNQDEQAALVLAKSLSHVVDIKSLDSHTFKLLEENLSHIQRIFSSSTGTLHVPYGQPDDLADLFQLAQTGAVVVPPEVIGKMYEQLARFVIEKKLSRAAVDRVVAVCGNDSRFNVRVGGIEINRLQLALASPSLAVELEWKNVSEHAGQIIKNYVEKGELPNLSDTDEDAILDGYNFLEGHLFPSDIKERFLAALIDQAGLEKIKKNLAQYPKELEPLAEIENSEDLAVVKDLLAAYLEYVRQGFAEEPLRDLDEPSPVRPPLTFRPGVIDTLKTIPDREEKLHFLQLHLQCPEIHPSALQILIQATPERDVPKLIEAIKESTPLALEYTVAFLEPMNLKNLNFPLSLVLLHRANASFYGPTDLPEGKKLKDAVMENAIYYGIIHYHEWATIDKLLELSARAPTALPLIPLLFVSPLPTMLYYETDLEIIKLLDENRFSVDPSLLEKLKPVLDGTANRLAKFHILRTIARLPPEQWDASLQQIAFLLKQHSNHGRMEYVMEIFKRIPVEERSEEVLKNLADLFKEFAAGMKDPQLNSAFYQIFNNIPQHEIANLLKMASETFAEGEKGLAKLHLLALLCRIYPPEERAGQVEAIQQFFFQIPVEPFRLFDGIFREERPAAVDDFRILRLMGASYKDLMKFAHLSSDERRNVIESENPLVTLRTFEDHPLDAIRVRTIKLLDEIPPARVTPQLQEGAERLMAEDALNEILPELRGNIDPNRLALALETYPRQNIPARYFTKLYYLTKDAPLSDSQISEAIDEST